MERLNSENSAELKKINEFCELWEKLQEYINNAPTIHEIDEYELRLDQGIKDGNNKGEELFNERYSGLTIQDFDTLRLIYSHLGFDDQTIEEEVSHEEQHYNAALETVAIPTIHLKAMRDIDDRLMIQASVGINIPDDLDEVTVNAILEKVISAPDKLSESDQRQIGFHNFKQAEESLAENQS